MTMKLISYLLAVGLLGYLAGAQKIQASKFPKVNQNNPSSPQNVLKNPLKPPQPQRQPPVMQSPFSNTERTANPLQNANNNPISNPNQKTVQEPVVSQVREPLKTCAVTERHKISCGPADTSADECQAMNCCFENQRCYYGKYVTLQCTKDGEFIVVVARDATLPYIDLESISFLASDDNCIPRATNPSFVIYQFPVTSCGSVVKEDRESGVIAYENMITSSYEVLRGPNGDITRDTHFSLHVECRYVGVSAEAVVIRVDDIPPPVSVQAAGPLSVQLRLANGQCEMKGCVEADVAYNTFYSDSDYPIRKVLRDPVYVDVYMAGRNDPNLALTLGRCWATADPSPQSLPQWDLLIDGCPYRDDRYQTTLIPVTASPQVAFPSHHRYFEFKMFTFVSIGFNPIDQSNPSKKTLEEPQGVTPLDLNIYIHCETTVCQLSPTNNCQPQCFRKRREILGSPIKTYREERTQVASSGLIIISGEDVA